MSASLSAAWLLLALWIWPLLLAPLAARWRWAWLPALGAVPALIAALVLAVDTRLQLPWLLLGAELGLDDAGRVVLLFSSLLWLLAGVFVATLMRSGSGSAPQSGLELVFTPKTTAQPPDSFAQRRFNAFFLLAMSGQLWAVVGLDVISFYVGFAIMGLASYALVVADGSALALRAGRLYLAMTVVGEVALFAGLVSIAAATKTLTPTPELLVQVNDLSLTMLLLGLGVKAAIVPLHLWLPLTYPAAPVAATAVLSSAMIKVALLGWLRWLPLGAVAWPGWSLALVLIGLTTTLYALAIGLTQREPKVVLAYSSISKMGFLLLLLGLMLGQPELSGVGVTAMLFYAAHHALTKAGLFLGLGLYEQDPLPGGQRMRRWLLAGLGFLALALAGAPLTSGAVAKYLTKPLLSDPPWGWLDPLLWLMSLATLLLMARLVWLVYRGADSRLSPTHQLPASHQLQTTQQLQVSVLGGLQAQSGASRPALIMPLVSWGLLLGLIAALPWVVGSASAWLTNLGTTLLALAVCALVLVLARRGFQPWIALVGRIPPGDLLPLVQLGMRPLNRTLGWLWRGWQKGRDAMARRLVGGGVLEQPAAKTAASPTIETILCSWSVAGALWLALGTLLLSLLLAGGLG